MIHKELFYVNPFGKLICVLNVIIDVYPENYDCCVHLFPVNAPILDNIRLDQTVRRV